MILSRYVPILGQLCHKHLLLLWVHTVVGWGIFHPQLTGLELKASFWVWQEPISSLLTTTTKDFYVFRHSSILYLHLQLKSIFTCLPVEKCLLFTELNSSSLKLRMRQRSSSSPSLPAPHRGHSTPSDNAFICFALISGRREIKKMLFSCLQQTGDIISA